MDKKKKIPNKFVSKLPAITITKVLNDFLDDQKKRLKLSTFSNYNDIIELLSNFINEYTYNYLNNEEREFFDELHDNYDMEFCDVFGPEHLFLNIEEFFGYFLLRKVIVSRILLKTSGTIIKKLVKWLVERGYTEYEDMENIQEITNKASKDLLLSQELTELLYDYSRNSSYDDFDETVEDIFVIKRIQKGKIWLSGFIYDEDEDIGPVPVPEEFSKKCRIDWCINSEIGKTRKGWKIVDVYQVKPE